MNKYLIQSFIVLIVILLGVSLVSEVNDHQQAKTLIESFDKDVSSDKEVENGEMEDVSVVMEDSSNLISNVNAKVANLIVKGLNKLLNLGIKLIEGVTN